MCDCFVYFCFLAWGGAEDLGKARKHSRRECKRREEKRSRRKHGERGLLSCRSISLMLFVDRCCAYDNDNRDPKYWEEMADREPWPRFAHQLVYDSLERKHYLFGGKPSDVPHAQPRLGDFWFVMQ